MQQHGNGGNAQTKYCKTCAVPERVQPPQPPRCPELPPDAVGICIEECGPSGSSCPDGQVCCSNGCGHVCTDPVHPSDLRRSRQTTGPVATTHPCAAILCKPCTVCREANGRKAVCIPSHDRSCCKGGIVYCFVDPCQVTTCPAHPDAICQSNYCGGCNAEFYDDQGRLVTDCDTVSPCATVLCEPCSLCEATKTGKAVCVPSHEGKCCTEGIVNCLVDPCQFASCPAHPGASCVSNYCGGCNAEFYDDNGQLLTDCGTDPSTR